MTYEMYQEAILDHYRNPRNRGELEDPDMSARADNPLCGDDIALYMKLNKDKVVEEVRFQGQGCAISQASASMMTVMLKGKTLEEVQRIDKESVLKTLGIPISPVRLKCALLSLDVLKLSLESLKHGDS